MTKAELHSSPWGHVDHQRNHAPGIDFVSTPSHGGYHLSEERQAQFLACGTAFHAFGPRWLEEDCDAVLIYLAWPELARDEQLAAAEDIARMIARWSHSAARWQPIVDWLNSPRRESIRRRAQAHRDSVRNLYERGGMASVTPPGVPDKCWSVNFYRPNESGGRDLRVVFMEYPQKRYYTAAELDELHHEPTARPKIEKHRSGFPHSVVRGNTCDIGTPSDADPGL